MAITNPAHTTRHLAQLMQEIVWKAIHGFLNFTGDTYKADFIDDGRNVNVLYATKNSMMPDLAYFDQYSFNYTELTAGSKFTVEFVSE